MEPLPYTLLSFDEERGGAVYPFLEETGRAWQIVTRRVDQSDVSPHPTHTFGRERPTLRWVNGEQINDLYVDGMTTEQFLAATGLELDLHKGGFVLSKRLSRIMRPHRVSGFFPAEDVTVAYMEQTPAEAKVWDGAGLVSRRMLRQMVLSEDLPPARRERLEGELRHAGRVEFTVMTPQGQDKGHAVVADDLRDEDGNPVDFLLPQDTKREVRLAGDRTFVGLSFVHGHNEMRLDIQSLINLHPFFGEEQLLGWLEEEGDLFLEAVETGRVAEAMGRIDRHTTVDDLASWPLREYAASGGHPMWFRSHVKGLLNQHLKRLNHTTLEKMRLPIPGGRHYVMPVAVGKRAGIRDLEVPRGEIQIDAARGTAWVNDDDWLALPDSPGGEGIAGILGGADHDDALWLHPFTDYDGERKVLAWRSPNQVGEYVILRPAKASHDLPWETAGETAVSYPPGDSRTLPARVDHTETDYLGLVDPATAGGLGEGEGYSVDVMAAAIERALANQGGLGMYCNSLMVNKALYGRLPHNPPAPLEDIIDSAVKTGADLSRVVAWNYENSRGILQRGTPVPALLQRRLSIDWTDEEKRPPRPRTSGAGGRPPHWLDRLERGVMAHTRRMEAAREELAARARPPAAALEGVDEEMARLGAGLNRVFAAALNREDETSFVDRLPVARRAVAEYLSCFPPEKRPFIMQGALVSVYGEEAGEGASDAALWLSALDPEEATQPWQAGVSPAGEMMAALREAGVLDEIVETKAGLVVYPAGVVAEEERDEE